MYHCNNLDMVRLCNSKDVWNCSKIILRPKTVQKKLSSQSRPSSPKSKKLVPYIPLLTMVVVGLQKTYSRTEVGVGL